MAEQEQVEILKQGVEVWNNWRKRNTTIIPDLSEADLSEAVLPEINLSVTNLYGARLNNTNLRDASFVGADLRKAILVNANLIKTKFGKAKLNEANLSGAEMMEAKLIKANLEGACLIGVDLSDASLREANLSRAIFQHAELQEADFRPYTLQEGGAIKFWLDDGYTRQNFAEAIFREANLREATFRGADLRNADFSAANLSGVDFRGADLSNTRLTGACVEGWNISSDTKTVNVLCDYLYIKGLYQERRPSHGTFAPGQFSALFQQALETVDLIFADGIDWQAFFQSFQELRTQYDNLSIQAIEKKSGGAFVIRLEVPPEADKAAIESQAKQLYEGQIRLLEERVSEYRDEVIFLRQSLRQSNTNIERIVETMAENQSPKYDFRGSNIGNFVDTAQAGSHQSNVQYINMSQDLTQAAQQIQDLLQQLQTQGVTVEDSQQQVATDMAKQAETNPAMMGKLVLWGKAMANKASETTVSEAAKMVLTLALKAAGIPLP
ncbi:MAG: pentapeptide repeat-containing protein [Leptolyngbya sp. UWPOB_LEPTO1]|uniref:pentapeptide repeat-containing protein n=1 Tax=Leptolyngbya sp. UWPOB_LEPTO1 TaxID=2815653 RepID=UPI001AC973AB|nr:pentapeptide repeat-containing protein [Leptolyngbya sp. UWPOB_LEPTO1]MBN8564240.1 pentapeptide repeat-containing protein [Leptolyngbya sp. UWPOB_LEPTO1]